MSVSACLMQSLIPPSYRRSNIVHLIRKAIPAGSFGLVEKTKNNKIKISYDEVFKRGLTGNYKIGVACRKVEKGKISREGVLITSNGSSMRAPGLLRVFIEWTWIVGIWFKYSESESKNWAQFLQLSKLLPQCLIWAKPLGFLLSLLALDKAEINPASLSCRRQAVKNFFRCFHSNIHPSVMNRCSRVPGRLIFLLHIIYIRILYASGLWGCTCYRASNTYFYNDLLIFNSARSPSQIGWCKGKNLDQTLMIKALCEPGYCYVNLSAAHLLWPCEKMQTWKHNPHIFTSYNCVKHDQIPQHMRSLIFCFPLYIKEFITSTKNKTERDMRQFENISFYGKIIKSRSYQHGSKFWQGILLMILRPNFKIFAFFFGVHCVSMNLYACLQGCAHRSADLWLGERTRSGGYVVRVWWKQRTSLVGSSLMAEYLYAWSAGTTKEDDIYTHSHTLHGVVWCSGTEEGRDVEWIDIHTSMAKRRCSGDLQPQTFFCFCLSWPGLRDEESPSEREYLLPGQHSNQPTSLPKSNLPPQPAHTHTHTRYCCFQKQATEKKRLSEESQERCRPYTPPAGYTPDIHLPPSVPPSRSVFPDSQTRSINYLSLSLKVFPYNLTLPAPPHTLSLAFFLSNPHTEKKKSLSSLPLYIPPPSHSLHPLFVISF
ncbi:hypothetical protein VP01_27g6 [Puccinia sorghi]|uniref:Uncharacterized protein n=1 Tax=Puccinia sorghi TaxID=27349 RepID=A0A0L6V2K5_9BASI|nr:hypothetical protein VP01_27g6 [Puccinia sorghi]